jgi:predicted metal-dependent hydrolase
MTAPSEDFGKAHSALARLPEAVRRGIEMFNHREFMEAHHVLQHEWYQEHDPVRLLYQAIVQIGAAALHVQRGHWHQALTLFERAKPKLAVWPPQFLGVNVERLARDARHCEDLVREAGPEGLPQCDLDHFPVIEVQERPSEHAPLPN